MKYSDLKILKNINSICLIGHIDPDPDALASMVVLKHFIKNYFNCKTIDIFAECNAISDNLKPIIEDEVINPEIKKYDVSIMMDSPSIERLGIYSHLFTNSNRPIVIDHHATNTYSGKINIVENCSSTCEIVYSILKDFKYEISKEDQGKLYAGIITDTNNFSVGNITSTTFQIAAEFESNINIYTIYNHFLANHSLKNMKLLGKAIQNIKTFNDAEIIISHITHDEASALNADFNDYYGIINYIATINTAKLVCFIKPKNNSFYVGMRSRKNCGDVSIVAKKHGGGGHKGAAAFTTDMPIEQIEELISEEFKKQISSHNSFSDKIF